MVAHGCEFKEALRPSDGRRGQGKYITATPGELVSKLMPLVQERGRVLAGHRLAEIVYDSQTARVTGVVCEAPDGPVRIGATGGVVVCSGPWPDDEVLGARHLPAAMGEMPAAVAQTMVSMGMPFGPYTGEAVRAAQKIGAAVRHMEYVMPDPYYAVPELMLQRVAAFGVSRSVNQVLIGADGQALHRRGQDARRHRGRRDEPARQRVLPRDRRPHRAEPAADGRLGRGYGAVGGRRPRGPRRPSRSWRPTWRSSLARRPTRCSPR